MNTDNQHKLDELIAESKTMYDDAAMQAFAVKWRIFLHSLNKTDGKIACYAYFTAIFETLDLIQRFGRKWYRTRTPRLCCFT